MEKPDGHTFLITESLAQLDTVSNLYNNGQALRQAYCHMSAGIWRPLSFYWNDVQGSVAETRDPSWIPYRGVTVVVLSF